MLSNLFIFMFFQAFIYVFTNFRFCQVFMTDCTSR
nr:MAG TPA: hypothetical protein [Bacteriophage sp.]